MPEQPKRRLRDRAMNAATLISEGAHFSGILSGSADILVSGTVEGNCDIDGALTISDGGHWDGSVRAREVVVLGTVDGDIVAASRVEIGRSAVVRGKISAAEIAVAEGAVVDGEMHTTSDEEPLQFTEKRAAQD